MSEVDNTFVEALRTDTQQLSSGLSNCAENGEISAATMMQQPATEMDCLLFPLLPRVGTVSFIGSSDTGKSCFLRGLAVAIASGADNYIGFRLFAQHRRTIYVSTEDDEQAICYLLHKQNKDLGLPVSAYAGLDYLFQTDNLIATLDKILCKKPSDIVIIDAFADIYDGSLNENNKVRAFLQQYNLLAIKHKCLVLFLHHTGKRTEDFVPSKHNAIGSQGFEAKMRFVAELRNDPFQSNIKHFCIVKGNYLPSDYKQSSFELNFSENMTFTRTGRRVPFEELRRKDPEREEKRNSKVTQIKELIAQGKTYEEIAQSMGYKSKSAITQILKRAEQ